MSSPSFRLDGQVALVTGGSRGLGRGIAAGLAGAGAQVMVTSRSGDAEQTLAMIRDVGGHGAATAYEIGEDPADGGLVDTTIQRLGRLDIVVNNAGIQRRGAVTELTLDDWQAVITANLTAAWVVAQAAAGHMVGRGRGKIINTASLLSFQGGIRVPAYAAAKHGIAGLTRAMCNELAASGVNVNAIVPGYMATEMNTALLDDPERSRDILARIPAGRWGTEDDVAGAAVFLASDASDYVHGHLLAVDGGWLAR